MSLIRHFSSNSNAFLQFDCHSMSIVFMNTSFLAVSRDYYVMLLPLLLCDHLYHVTMSCDHLCHNILQSFCAVYFVRNIYLTPCRYHVCVYTVCYIFIVYSLLPAPYWKHLSFVVMFVCISVCVNLLAFSFNNNKVHCPEIKFEIITCISMEADLQLV